MGILNMVAKVAEEDIQALAAKITGKTVATVAEDKAAPVLSEQLSNAMAKAQSKQAYLDEFHPDTFYHGTAQDFDSFSKDKLGSLTLADSAKQGFFFSRSPNTAGQYADMAKEANPAQVTTKSKLLDDISLAKSELAQMNKQGLKISSGGDDITWIQEQIKNDEAHLAMVESGQMPNHTIIKGAEGGDTGPNIIPVKLRFSNPKEVDMNYTSYADKNRPLLGDEIRKAKAEGHDAVIFKNFSDLVHTDTSDLEKEHIKNYVENNKDSKASKLIQYELGRLNDPQLKEEMSHYTDTSGDYSNRYDNALRNAIDLVENDLPTAMKAQEANRQLQGWQIKYLEDAKTLGITKPEDIGKIRSALSILDERAKIARKDFTDQVVVFSPNQIRSVNAKFNPAKKSSDNLLYGVGGVGVGTAAMSQQNTDTPPAPSWGSLNGIKP